MPLTSPIPLPPFLPSLCWCILFFNNWFSVKWRVLFDILSFDQLLNSLYFVLQCCWWCSTRLLFHHTTFHLQMSSHFCRLILTEVFLSFSTPAPSDSWRLHFMLFFFFGCNYSSPICSYILSDTSYVYFSLNINHSLNTDKVYLSLYYKNYKNCTRN